MREETQKQIQDFNDSREKSRLHFQKLMEDGVFIERKLDEEYTEIPVKYITDLKVGDYIRCAMWVGNGRTNIWRRIDGIDYSKGIIKYIKHDYVGNKILYDHVKFNRHKRCKFVK